MRQKSTVRWYIMLVSHRPFNPQTDARLEFMSEPLSATLYTLVPQAQAAEKMVFSHILRTTYPVLIDHLQPSTEKTLRHIVSFIFCLES